MQFDRFPSIQVVDWLVTSFGEHVSMSVDHNRLLQAAMLRLGCHTVQAAADGRTSMRVCRLDEHF